MGDESANGERSEGETYEFVRELNDHLHQAREEIDQIQQTLTTVR